MKTAETIGSELAALIRGDVRVDIFNRTVYSRDASIYRIVPECVVVPKDEADVVGVVAYAAENHIPVAPRGAGSGIAGESLTRGIVIDVCRFMNAILETAPDGSWVRVQPGVVLDTLNAHLARWGRKIGPDPSSGNRAVIGGIVANNATGAHSLQYGYIANYVRQMRAVLADGSVAVFTNRMPGSPATPQGRLVQSCLDLLADKQELIERVQPTTQRNRCAYTIQHVVHDDTVDMARLLTGSEGTLAVYTEVILTTVPLPASKGLVQFEFSGFESMAHAVDVIVKSGASACELMDRTLMDIVLQAYPKYRDIVPSDAAATLLVEHVADNAEQLREKIDQTIEAVGSLATGHMKVLDQARQAFLWKSRKDAVPLLGRQKGRAKPIGFIEDVSVDPRYLDKYLAGLDKIGKQYAIPMAFYGHAGDGELHIRPYLDLHQPREVERMQQIAEAVFTLAWELGGSISGEHGDGLLRAAFIRRQYGDEYMELLRGIKTIFDPAGIMNPGKIVNDDPDVMIRDLRAATLEAAEGFQTELQVGPEEFFDEVQQCNGCGVCLSQSAGTRMCPVFRGLGQEIGSSRAKANLLDAWVSGQFPTDTEQLRELKQKLSLCVNCKMCSIECPSGMDISTLIIEARAQLARRTGFTMAELMLTHNRWLGLMAGTFSPISNWVMSMGMTKWFLEKLMGLDRTRSFPKFQRGTFIKKGRRSVMNQPPLDTTKDKVVYFVDTYANRNDHALGFAVLEVLRKLNVETVLPDQRPTPLPAYVYGNLKTARQDLTYNIKNLLPMVEQGCKIVCSEPSAALCLKDEMPLLLKSPDVNKISDVTVELMDYVNSIQGVREMQVNPDSIEKYAGYRIAYHAPCHLKALRKEGITIDLLRHFGVKVTDLNAGCCGLAGTAGMQKKNHELSAAIGETMVRTMKDQRPDIVLTECAACKMQIEHLTGCTVIHPVKILNDIFAS